MKNPNQIVPATLEHAKHLATRLRKADLAEIAAATGDTPEDALIFSLAFSPRAWAWLYNGRVQAIFGVALHPLREGVGIPWMLAAASASRHKVFLVRQSRKYVELMLDVVPYLENHVDCRNTASIQWLSWCGFALAEVVPFFGVQRLPFVRFCLARS